MKKILLIAVIITTCLMCFFGLAFLAASIGSGTLSYAQEYQFNVNKIQLASSIKEFKDHNIEFKPPIQYGFRDTLDAYTHNYKFYIYIPDNNTIFCFLIHEYKPILTSLFLVSVNEGFNSPYFKRINRDLDRHDNLRVKREFKQKILNKLGIPYKDNGNAMFIFWK